MKLKLDGSFGILLMMVMEFLKLDLPEEEEPDTEGPTEVPIVPVVGEDPVDPTIPPPPPPIEIIEQIIENTYPSPVVIISDIEEAEIERREHVDSIPTIDIPETIDRTIHRTIE